jgi:hypothetical protein
VLGAVAAIAVLIAGLAALGSNRSNDNETAGKAADTGGGAGFEGATSTTAPGSGVDLQRGGDGSGSEEALNSVPKATPPTDAAKIVKTGSIEIEVKRGSFERAVDLITTEAVGLGGYVANSRTSRSDDRPSGSLTVRVPVDSFEKLESDLRELGKVGSVTSKGTDVTAQFTDLDARLKALVATRDRLETVLAQASTVGDILAVQDRITAVQTQIEQIQGQQQVLEDQASFGTWAIALGEPGTEVRSEPAKDRDGLGQAWDDARRRFGDGIEGIVAWSGPIAIIVIVGAMLLALGRLGWVVVRRFTM